MNAITPRIPRLLRIAVEKGALEQAPLSRMLASEPRYRVLKEGLVETLARHRVTLLPESISPSFCEQPERPNGHPGKDPLAVYWNDLGRLRPTSREEEFFLARVIDLLRATILRLLGPQPSQAGLALAQEFLSIYSPVLKILKESGIRGTDKPLDQETRDRLQQRLTELQRIQHALVDRNLYTVPATARRYQHAGVAYEDLIQEGNASLLRAVESYNRLVGVRFSHYASWWIHQGILKALSFQSRTVRLPVYLAQALHRVQKAQARDPELQDPAAIARMTDLSPEKVERALKAERSCLSLERSCRPGAEETMLRDLIADPRPAPLPEPDPYEGLRGTLQTLMGCLPQREARVLTLRFGLEGGKPQTLEQVGEAMEISRERVRQLQAQSLRRLTRLFAHEPLERYL
ncbi:MAG: RNA polymerase sigma factor RpoD/SigA [Planctomycetota bacterium]